MILFVPKLPLPFSMLAPRALEARSLESALSWESGCPFACSGFVVTFRTAAPGHRGHPDNPAFLRGASLAPVPAHNGLCLQRGRKAHYCGRVTRALLGWCLWSAHPPPHTSLLQWVGQRLAEEGRSGTRGLRVLSS